MSEFENELAGAEDGDTSFPYGHNAEALQPWSESERVRTQIYNELEGSTLAAFKLEQSWTRLGVLLSEFKQKELWRYYSEYQTYDDFIHELGERFKRGRTILYGYVGAVEALLPIMSAENIEQIGISKCLELKRAMKQLNGKPLPEAVIVSALSGSTAKELRADIGKALNATPDEKGTWFDMGGMFMTADERKEFKEAFLMTEGLLGLSNTVPDHIRRKEVINAWLQEFVGSHAAEFNGVQQPKNAAPALLTHFKVSAELLNDAAFDDAQHGKDQD